jgi:hypothetical protein
MKKAGLAKKIQQHLKAREAGKANYQEAEELLEALAKGMKAGQEVKLPGGRKAILRDNFAERNKVYRAHGISRFEIEVVEA